LAPVQKGEDNFGLRSSPTFCSKMYFIISRSFVAFGPLVGNKSIKRYVFIHLNE